MPIHRDGQVALVRYMPIEEHIKVGDKMYHFNPKRGISLCWVNDKDEEVVLAVRRSCCGGTNNRRIFQFANQAQIDIWEKS